MDSTETLSLPYIAPLQANKHITHNEALLLLDALVHIAVADRDLAAPPGSPVEGVRYIVAAAASGDWTGKSGLIAQWQEEEWVFTEPAPGWLCLALDEDAFLFWSGSQWVNLSGAISALQNLSLLGLGTAADADNRFAAKLNKALWTALTSGEGGTGDLRYTLNKQGAANVLSLLMQSNWSGRAEIGLVGNDDLAVKVSANGSDWTEALRIDRQSGRIGFPRTNLLRDFAVSLLPDSGRFAGNAAKSDAAGTFAFPSYLSVTNGTTTTAGGKFITNNTDYGGSAGALDPEIRALVDQIRAPTHRRYGVEFHAAEITMGSGTAGDPVVVGGVNHYFSTFLTFGPRTPSMTFHCYLRALDAPIAYRRHPGQTMVKNGVEGVAHVPISPSDGWVSMTVRDEQDLYASSGYNPTPLSIYVAQAGHRYLLACPALMGGITGIDDNIGPIAGINRWLP